MDSTRKVAVTLLGCCSLLLVLAVPGAARGAEFSASMLVKDGVKTIPGKMYVSDGKMRQEFVDEQGQTITIVRPDLKVVWVILPRQRIYLEMPLTKKLPGQFIQIPPQAVGKRLVGHDRVNGYDTDKYQVAVRGGRGLRNPDLLGGSQIGPAHQDGVPGTAIFPGI